MSESEQPYDRCFRVKGSSTEEQPGSNCSP